MRTALAYIHKQLDGLYSAGELRELIRWMMEAVCGIPSYRLLLADDVLSEKSRKKICHITDRLARYEPIQYIMEYISFCGCSFYLTPDVLIPRPETAELVMRIVSDYENQKVQILDIGTGSGCIAVSLAKMLPEARVSALDISDKALQVAQSNAVGNHVCVHFINQDVMSDSVSDELSFYDCIVSNPPYIAELEKETMERNVLDYEPHLALFVSDDDPLCFYRRIAQLSKFHFRKEGQLYFEINERYGVEVQRLLERENYKHIALIQDSFGKDRIIKARYERNDD